MEIKGSHWARVAFLRLCFVEFPKLSKGPETGSAKNTSTATNDAPTNDNANERKVKQLYNKNHFWSYVDDSLDDN
ncbi:hypothetical protein E1B28_005158 [Marasmius oreades]|uniref:Uncharacterized protein n=1 Tax=Marasmius oreades TaxID=181124 RepID=A0A9P8ADU4_9AGAR|nr:uncharacterized protein E1B28_005158 [Marasmius oreades]KAG7097843.1 hypothetical protein E1B28_005158 [Marasmius oreades]